ncbi:MAG: VOC family protein [Dehalococcoidia bacterium]
MTELHIDHLNVVVPSLEACAPYERLGLALSRPAPHRGLGTEDRELFVGHSSNTMCVELIAFHDVELARKAAPARAESYLEVLSQGGGAARLYIGTDDPSGLAETLKSMGATSTFQPIVGEDGVKRADVIMALEGVPQLGIELGVISVVEPLADRYATRKAGGLFNHSFPLKRLDHVVVVVENLDSASSAWAELGATVAGNFRNSSTLIRQMQLGDAAVALVQDPTPRSVGGRRGGLVSMAAWEVADLGGAVAIARDRGFHASEPEPAAVPGARVSRIPAAELAGLEMELVQYV